jgi:hypothetical protein
MKHARDIQAELIKNKCHLEDIVNFQGYEQYKRLYPQHKHWFEFWENVWFTKRAEILKGVGK